MQLIIFEIKHIFLNKFLRRVNFLIVICRCFFFNILNHPKRFNFVRDTDDVRLPTF